MTRPARAVTAGAVAALLASGGAALAQSSGSGSGFNKGYGGSTMETPVNVSRAYDTSGNTVVVDGVNQAGQSGSVFYSRQSSGAGDTSSGVGAVSGGTAIGNNLQVSVQGSYNTVVVNSTQTNNAPVTTTTVLNGQVNLDGGNGN